MSSYSGWLIVIAAQAALVVIIILLERRALRNKEVEHITFSRLMWRLFERWPWTRWAVGAFFLGLALFNAWGFVHIFFGPCAFGICP